MMKKLFFFGMMGAMALTFAACSSEDEVANVNPTYDGTSVKTAFALNIGQLGNATRMTAAAAQQNANYLGITAAYLYPTIGTVANSTQHGTLTGSVYSLGAIGNGNVGPYDAANSGATNFTELSNKIYNISIPVGVNNFLFYATAGQTQGAANGKLVYTLGGTDIDAITFALSPIVTVSQLEANETTLLGILNGILAVEGFNAENTNQTLKDMYTNLTTIKEGEVRAGSGFDVRRTCQDIYRAAALVNDAGTNTVAAAIMTKIAESFNITGEGQAATLAYKTAALETFPESLGIPAGAAQLTFKSGAFAYVNDAHNAFGTGSGINAISVGDITYPAELMYYDNSPLKATNIAKEVSDYPNGVTNWDNATKWSADWTQTAVAADTRAVAMTNNVNYGVALMSTTVKAAADNLLDNRKALVDPTNGTDQEIAISDLELTGILIGGQPTQVGWNFEPAATGAKFTDVVYDKTIVTSTVAKTAGAPTYTILLDNKGTDASAPVNVALEFKNNSTKDFYGAKNIIPAGAKFYLVGKLELSSKEGTITPRGGTYRIDESTNRVFVQDHVTVANFTINSLKAAYSTIPDLQSIAMLFGLSVDLKWEPGFTFNYTIQ